MTERDTRLFFGKGASQPIFAAADLRLYLPEDKRYQYQDGYSVAETAKCWVNANGKLPRGIAAIVGDDEFRSAHFEYPVIVWGGGKSMTDVLPFLPDSVAAVEGKACEPFGGVVHDWIIEDEGKNPRSSPYREGVIDRYAEEFQVPSGALLDMRYQLLHRTLSAAIVAHKLRLKRAWMIVQSFAPLNCVEHVRNRTDFDRYVGLVGDVPVMLGVPVRLRWIDESL